MSRRFVLGGLFVALAAVSAEACLWDSDTLSAEARGLPGVVDAIVGRFDRNPPLYYEMRLERVARLIDADPTDLAAYDDSAVACDRLGRSDEAIGWMERKDEQLRQSNLPAVEREQHRYRYLANLGTFHVHRWVRNGGNREDLDDVVRARDLIAEAIGLNPDAHFGRETYQLLALEWILDPPRRLAGETDITAQNLPTLLEKAPDPEAIRKDPQTLRGLTGLIVLGAAWESVDLFHALHKALSAQRHASLALLAELRFRELVGNGRRSLHPMAPTESEPLIQALSRVPAGAEPEHTGPVQQFFGRARQSAERFHEYRSAFMLERLKAGRHPDTDAGFWNGYDPPPAPTLPGAGKSQFAPDVQQITLVSAATAVVLLGAAVFIWLRRRKRATAGPSSAEHTDATI